MDIAEIYDMPTAELVAVFEEISSELTTRLLEREGSEIPEPKDQEEFI